MKIKYDLAIVRREIEDDQAIAEQPDKTGTTVELSHEQIQKLVAIKKLYSGDKRHGNQ